MTRIFIASLPALVILAGAFLFLASPVLAECGKITYYHATGNKTACGDKYTGEEMFAAHRSLPCGTKLKVVDQITKKWVSVTVRDRGPAAWTGNSLDVSYRAARKLGMVQRGKIRGCW